jgi:uncharacterized circularly permuted ATP-grasp superfamily protein
MAVRVQQRAPLRQRRKALGKFLSALVARQKLLDQQRLPAELLRIVAESASTAGTKARGRRSSRRAPRDARVR